MAEGFSPTLPRSRLTPAKLRTLFVYYPSSGRICWRVTRYGAKGSVRARPGDEAGHINGQGYREISVDRVAYQAHRIAWAMQRGRWPRGHLDHKNNRRADNRWRNLRLATRRQNARNRLRRSDNSVGFKGVSLHRKTGKYQASIGVRGRQIYLGLHDAAAAAHAAYCAEAKKRFGRFSNTGSANAR